MDKYKIAVSLHVAAKVPVAGVTIQRIVQGSDTCVCCGEPIPEGRMVCPVCEGKYVDEPIGKDYFEVVSICGTIMRKPAGSDMARKASRV